MKAAIREKYGNPSDLKVKEVANPIPKDNEVLIRVHATTINRTDIAVLTGRPLIFRLFAGLLKPQYNATGVDFAGEIVAIGSAVKLFKVGDRVWGFHDHGIPSHAEYLAYSEKGNIALIPNDWPYEKIVACAEGAHYAKNFINKVDLKAGQNAMVMGGTGAIGSALIQFLKHHGLAVNATCRGQHIYRVKKLGADKVYDYLKEDFKSDSNNYDYVFDAVGKSSFGECKKLLKPQGIYISSELGPGNENLYLPVTTLFSKGKKVIFPLPTNIMSSMEYVTSLINAGAFEPLIDRSYPLEEIAEAFKYVMTGQKVGNVIVRI